MYINIYILFVYLFICLYTHVTGPLILNLSLIPYRALRA